MDSKWIRLSTLKQCLDPLEHNPREFLRQVVTADETWINYYTPETKDNQKSRFYDFLGLERSNPHGLFGERTHDHSELLDQFDKKLKETRPHSVKTIVLFHHDNALACSSGIVAAKLHKLRCELLPHLLYLPNLVPYDSFLFPIIKTWFEGKKFSSNEEIIVETAAYFNEFDKSYFLKDFKKWP